MHHITKAKPFTSSNILIISLYLNFCTKIRPFWFFGHPVLPKWPCFTLVFLFLKKGTINIPHHKIKTFHETQYFDYILISNFLHQNKAILIFGPVWLYGLVLAWSFHFWKKAPQMHNITKAKLFLRPNILIISIYLNFEPK